MGIFIKDYDYQKVLLVDTAGNIRFIYPPSHTPSRVTLPPLSEIKSITSQLSLLHFTDDLNGLMLDLQIPMYAVKGNIPLHLGTLLIMIDPKKTLYPLIQSWPTPSKSSETLLVRRDGDSILFLNELRHMKNTALRLKLPMQNDLPAAKAVMGYEGMFEGRDYRGVPVIAYVKGIPDSPWFMVAKVDKKEIYSSLRNIITFTLIIALLIIALFSITAIFLWRVQHIRYLKELNTTKDKFFSIVSHDLRSPFGGIYGFANLLVEDLQKDAMTSEDLKQVRKYAELIRFSSMNAMDFLNNLIEWARLNTERIVAHLHDLDLIPVIHEVMDLLENVALCKSITFKKSLPSALYIYADEDMIKLIIRNLISNSIKFTHPGGNIMVSAVERDKEVLVEVTDTGIGMEKEKIEQLSQIGEKLSTPGTRNERGNGLGLILAKEFLSLHSGKLFIESEVGKFSKFGFTIPKG